MLKVCAEGLIQVVLLNLLQSVLVSPDGRLLLDLDLMMAPQFIHFLFDGVEMLQLPLHLRLQRLEVHLCTRHLSTETSGHVTKTTTAGAVLMVTKLVKNPWPHPTQFLSSCMTF